MSFRKTTFVLQILFSTKFLFSKSSNRTTFFASTLKTSFWCVSNEETKTEWEQNEIGKIRRTFSFWYHKWYWNKNKKKYSLHSTEATVVMKPFELSPCILYFLPAMLLHYTLYVMLLWGPYPLHKTVHANLRSPLKHTRWICSSYTLRIRLCYGYAQILTHRYNFSVWY